MAKLSTDYKKRKETPVGTGVLDYFPDALAEVAHVSYVATQQHHPGQPMHWDKDKSKDHADCLIRHFLERGTVDTDGTRHSAKVAWRALALLQMEIEADVVRQTTNAGRDHYTALDAQIGSDQPDGHFTFPEGADGMVCSPSSSENTKGSGVKS